MNKPIQVLIVSAIVALLGVGVWWGVSKSKNTNTTVQNTNGQVNTNNNTTNQSANTNQSIVTNISITESSQSKVVVDEGYDYTFRFPSNWYSKEINTSINTTALKEGVQRLAVRNAPFSLEYLKSGEIGMSVIVYSSSSSLQDWYKEFLTNHRRDIYQSVNIVSTQDNIFETIITGSAPKKPIDTEWLDGRIFNTFLSVGDYVVQIEAVMMGDSTNLQNQITEVLKSLQKSRPSQ